MLEKFFKKKDQEPTETDQYKEIYCAFEDSGKTKVMIFSARQNYDKDNMICRNCKACE